MENISKTIKLPTAGLFTIADIPQAKEIVNKWTSNTGCNSVLEVRTKLYMLILRAGTDIWPQIVGNNSALTLAYDLVRPFGTISSVGVHQEPPLPFNGRQMYDKNISVDFGRCPVRAMLPIASKVLLQHQDIFGSIGEEASLIEKVVSLDEAPESYELFDKGKCGKVLFDPWR